MLQAMTVCFSFPSQAGPRIEEKLIDISAVNVTMNKRNQREPSIQTPKHFAQQNIRATFLGREYADASEGSAAISSARDHTYTPLSCALPGTVLSSMNATNRVTTMFKDIRPLIAKSS